MANKKVLIIEDDESIRTMYQLKLQQSGYEVEVACDGAEGLEKTSSFKPDLILLDVIMPRMDGFTALQKMFNKGITEKVPVIMLTNLSTEEDVEKGKKFGAKEYLVKSTLTPSQVNQAVDKYF